MIKHLLKDIGQYVPSRVIPVIVGIVTLPVVTRLFTPTDYGNYILVRTTIYVLMAIAGWVSLSVTRFYPSYEKQGKTREFTELIMKLTFLSILATSIVSLCILILLGGYMSEKLYHLMLIGIFVFIPTFLFSLLLNFLRIKRRINWYSGFSAWKSVIALIFGLVLVIIFHFGVEGLLLGTVISVGLALPFLWKVAVGQLQIHMTSREAPLQSTIGMATYSFPLVIGHLADWILGLSDRYVLQFFRGVREVGIYSVNYQISEHSVMLPASLFSLAFNPLGIIIWEKQGKEASQEFLARGTRYFILLCIPAIVGISVLREPIVNVLATPDYYQGAAIIPLVVLGMFLRGLDQRFGMGLAFLKRTHVRMYSLIICGLLNLGLNLLLVPKYGYIAAAATTLMCYAFLLCLTIIISRRYFKWRFPSRSLVKAACASAIMGPVVYRIGTSLLSSTLLNLILGMVVGIIVYSLMLFLLRELKASEIQALLDLKAKIWR